MAQVVSHLGRGAMYSSSVAPAYQGYQILHIGLALLPLIAGVDKFFNVLTTWSMYLAPQIPLTLGVNPSTFMVLVGIVEIIVAMVIALRPQVGGYFLAVWLWAIVLNLLLTGNYYDIAARDLALSLGALALARLSQLEFTVTSEIDETI